MTRDILNVPLKKELPHLCYDFAIYCEHLRKTISIEIPSYLSEYSKCLNYYADRVNEFVPNELPTGYRVYIVDYRLNVLFAAIDASGKMATFFSKYGKFAHTMEDYHYGDGEKIGDADFPSGKYNYKELKRFNEKYGFLPIDDISMSAAIVFETDEIADIRNLSQYQTQLLMQKYRRENCVDWEAIVKDVSNVKFF